MIFPLKVAGLLNGQLVAGALNNTDDPIGAVFVATDSAWIVIRKIKACGTGLYLLLYIDEASRKIFGHFALAF
jgi:hypothetical protein